MPKIVYPMPLAITWIWIAGFAIALVAIMSMFFLGYIESTHLFGALKSIAQAYSPHLAIMIGYCFKSFVSNKGNEQRNPHLFVLAGALSIMWNVALLALIVAPAAISSFGIDNATNAIGDLMPLMSWLVSPFVGLLFSMNAAKNDPAGSA